MWTDHKHSLFLQHLELSFVKQLHQSISLLDQDEEEINTSLIDQINLAGRLHGCSKIKCNRGYPLSHVSVDSIGHSKRPTVSAHTPEPWTLCKAENVGEVVKPNCDLHDSQREGTGQNFVDEDNQSNSDTEYRVKRTKIMLADK
ncbi:hypothetical protein SASPL_101154 [Salvia splendens]|uniref:Uncharacterized protein n=2 Tax=Salvia splendens TaxID=180675 RepID=A0A8X8YNR5_SALSN|nr:hypothetical protein SASPL_101154 [Salvia splendens]